MKKHSKKDSQQQDHDVLMDLNMTPLIDVMLVLIIMLIISIPIQQHSIDMNNPTINTQAPLEPPKTITLDILEHGEIRWNNQPLTLIELEKTFKNIASKQMQDEIMIHAAAKTDYKNVVNVLAAAQRQGVTKIGIYE